MEAIIIHPTIQVKNTNSYQKIIEHQEKIIYVGSCEARDFVKQEKFDWIIEIADEPTDTYISVDIPCYRFEFPDNRNFPLISVSKDISTCIASLRGKILLHCREGRSRSVAVLIFYSMIELNMSYDDALHHIRLMRPEARPNIGFERQLRKLQKELPLP
jgi:hypothetical protein